MGFLHSTCNIGEPGVLSSPCLMNRNRTMPFSTHYGGDVTGSARYVNGVPLEPRGEACQLLLSEFIRALQTLNEDADYDNNRLPVVANVGFQGSGKTSLLRLCMDFFTSQVPGSKAVYITFNDDQPYSETTGIAVRVLHRVACHLAREQFAFSDFVKLCPEVSEQDAIRVARSVLGMRDADHLLLAVDELVQLNELTPDGAVRCLQNLTNLMTSSFSVANQSRNANNDANLGVVYIVVSAYRAVDVLRLATKSSNRRVIVQSLWPLEYNESMRDALIARWQNKPHIVIPGHTSWNKYGVGKPMLTIRTHVMNVWWATGGHPRLVKHTLDAFEEQPETGDPAAFKEWADRIIYRAQQDTKMCWGRRLDRFFEEAESLDIAKSFVQHWLLRQLFCRGPLPGTGDGVQPVQRLLHIAQSKGIVNTVAYDDYTCASQVPRPVLSDLLSRDLPDSPLLSASRALGCELESDAFCEEIGKLFERIMFCAVRGALLSRTEPFALSELFSPVQSCVDVLNLPVLPFDSLRMIETDDATGVVYPFVRTGTTFLQTATCGLGSAPAAIAPSAMHTYCAVDAVIRLRLRHGGTLDIYLQFKEWYKDDLSGGTNIVSEFRKHHHALLAFHQGNSMGSDHHAVHILCTVNPVTPASWTRDMVSDGLPEAYLDLLSMRKWCPTAAFSTSAAMKLRKLVELAQTR